MTDKSSPVLPIIPRVFSLSSITRRIEEVFVEQGIFGKKFWVQAEAISCSEKNGNFYCELVEVDASGRIIAKMRCMIWSSDLRAVKLRYQQDSIEFSPEKAQIVLQCQVQFDHRYGLSLRGIDACPSLLLGNLERKKRELMEKLEKSGDKLRNKSLYVHPLPIRIGLIIPNDSAAEQDFLKTLFASGYGFKITRAACFMQGDKTSRSVCNAIRLLENLPVELIVIARGGGSRADLAWLDDEAIARGIACCRKPVWTGIGHEIDYGVLDFVAARHFKTPTAVAEEIVGAFDAQEQRLNALAQQVKSMWRQHDRAACKWLADAQTGLQNGARKHLDYHKIKLKKFAITPIANIGRRIQEGLGQCDAKRKKLQNQIEVRLFSEQAQCEERSSRLNHLSALRLSQALGDIRRFQASFKLAALLSPIQMHLSAIDGRTQQVMESVRFAVTSRTANLRRQSTELGFNVLKSVAKGHGRLDIGVERLSTLAATRTAACADFEEKRLEKLRRLVMKYLEDARWKFAQSASFAPRNAVMGRLGALSSYLDETSRFVGASSPQKALDRGYALVRKDGCILRQVAQLRPGDAVSVRMGDGEFGANLETVKTGLGRFEEG